MQLATCDCLPYRNEQWPLAPSGDSDVEVYLIEKKRALEDSQAGSRFLRAVTACMGSEGVVAEAQPL